MTVTLTTAQVAAVSQRDQAVLTALEIGLGTPLFYCDGMTTVSLDGDVYTPWPELAVSNIRLDNPANAGATITMADPDGELGQVWYSNRLTGVLVTMKEAIWSDGAWLTTRTLPWYINGVTRKEDGTMILKLSGGTSLRSRAGLEIADRSDWRYAPVPGETAYLGHLMIQV